MHDDAGRLVDDEEVLVLPGDRDRRLFRDELRRGLHGRFELELFTASQPVTLRPRGSVDEHTAVGKQAPGSAARSDLGLPREKAVEPLAGGLVRNASLHARAADAKGAARSRRA